jgi:hypothetical protein
MRPHVGDVDMGQQLHAGEPLSGSMVWVARHPRDYDLSIALVHIDVSSTPVPKPGAPDRQVLLVDIVYHYISIFSLLPIHRASRGRPSRQLNGRWPGHPLVWG